MEPTREFPVPKALNFISSHFYDPTCPRAISTRTTEGRQLHVFNKQETLTIGVSQAWVSCSSCSIFKQSH